MTPEDITGTDAPIDVAAAEPDELAPHVAARVEASTLRANLSAIASAQAQDFESTASAVGLAQVAGDAHVTASYVGIMYAKQGGTFQQGYASAVILGGDTTVRQAGAPLIVGRSMNIEQGGGMVLVGSDVKVNRGVVGIVVSGSTEISDDSKVLIGTKAAIIIAAALLGGFALVAVVMVLGAKRVSEWRPNINLPQLSQLPKWEELQEKLHQLRKSA